MCIQSEHWRKQKKPFIQTSIYAVEDIGVTHNVFESFLRSRFFIFDVSCELSKRKFNPFFKKSPELLYKESVPKNLLKKDFTAGVLL